MKMQNALRWMAVLKGVVLLAFPTAAFAGGSVTATAPVSVTILAPVSLEATQALAFGSVTKPSGAAGNTVNLDTSGAVTITGGGDSTHPASPTTAAKFDLVGPAGTTYSTSQSLSFDQPGLSRAVATSPSAGAGTLGVIPAAGVQELRFGGAFDLSAATPTGAYTGSLSVTVNYN
jgi:hypothetical protein